MHPVETYVILSRCLSAFPCIPEIRMNRVKISRSDPSLKGMSKFRMTSVFVKILSLILVLKHAQSRTYNPKNSFVFMRTKEKRYSSLPFSRNFRRIYLYKIKGRSQLLSISHSLSFSQRFTHVARLSSVWLFKLFGLLSFLFANPADPGTCSQYTVIFKKSSRHVEITRVAFIIFLT